MPQYINTYSPHVFPVLGSFNRACVCVYVVIVRPRATSAHTHASDYCTNVPHPRMRARRVGGLVEPLLLGGMSPSQRPSGYNLSRTPYGDDDNDDDEVLCIGWLEPPTRHVSCLCVCTVRISLPDAKCRRAYQRQWPNTPQAPAP